MSDRYDIICAGAALVDSIIKGFEPEPISASGFRAASNSLAAGGEAVNESSAAAKLGMRAAVLCALGDDEAGELVKGALERCGVDTGLIVSSKEHPTPVTTMFVNADGTRKSITNGSHRYNFHPERYVDCFERSRAVILGSLFRAPFDEPQIIHSVLKAAKDRGNEVFADTKLPNFRILGLKDIAPSLPFIDYITPNEDEAKHYTGKTSPDEMADVLLDMGVKNVIVKLGGRGCYYKGREGEISLPAHEIEAVDATGAGDNFVAGFASEILRGSSVGEALRFANACGAICTTAVGAGTALKNREQVMNFLKDVAGKRDRG